jgi:hypothetical protein
MNFKTLLSLYNDVTDTWLPRPGRPGYEQRRVVIAPSAQLPSQAHEWRDALVVLEQGRLEVECVGGNLETFDRGAVLCLAWLPLRLLRSTGGEPAVVLAVRRCRLTMGANGDL